MSDRGFLDSNVLIYAHTNLDLTKQQVAQTLARASGLFISTRVCSEFVNAMRKKFRLDWSIVRMMLDELPVNFSVHTNTTSTLKAGARLSEQYGFSWYDSLIIAAALECECERLCSEDLQHGQVIDGSLTIFNPFRAER